MIGRIFKRMRLLKLNKQIFRNILMFGIGQQILMKGIVAKDTNGEKKREQKKESIQQRIYKYIERSVVTIYEGKSNKVIQNGVIINNDGSFITVLSEIDPNKINDYYVKLMGDDKIYQVTVEQILKEDGIMIAKIQNRDQKQWFGQNQSNKFDSIEIQREENEIGQNCNVLGINRWGMLYIESGNISNKNVDSIILGEDYYTSQYNDIMNIGVKDESLFGSVIISDDLQLQGLVSCQPLQQQQQNNQGLIIPSKYLWGIIEQYKNNKEVHRPYLGFSIKEQENCLLVLNIHSNSPADVSGLKMGDQIIKVNSHQIYNINDLFKTVGYHLHQDIHITVQRNHSLINFLLSI